jgi:transposase InsO family protein
MPRCWPGRKTTTTAFPLRALRWFRAQGIGARRVMTDNGSACRSRRFAEALRLLGLRHIFTRPCTPKTNGKAERFIQTLTRMGLRSAIPVVAGPGCRPAPLA